MAAKPGGSQCKYGLDECRKLSSQLLLAPGRVHRSPLKIQELECNGAQRHQHAEDFAEAPVGQPALHPCANHAREKDVHQGIDRQNHHRGQRQLAGFARPIPTAAASKARQPTMVLGVSKPISVRNTR